MSDTVKGYTLRGKDYYSNIRGIRFEPIKKYDVTPYYKKGEKKVTKFLGFVLSEQTFEEDLYKRYGNLYTSEELVEEVGYLFIMGAKFIKKLLLQLTINVGVLKQMQKQKISLRP